MSESSNLKIGVRGYKEIVVAPEHLASTLGKGLQEVLSTPTMIAYMESTASDSVQALVPPGHSTVGVEVNIRHLAATPCGMKARFYSELIAIDGRNLTFKVWAEDEREMIGEGTHGRAAIENARFEARLARKRAGQ